MVIITYRKKILSITQIWFMESKENLQSTKTDVLFLHGVPENSKSKCGYSEIFHTLISNLSLSEEELLAQINKTERYQIRKNSKEEVECKVFMAEEMERQPEIVKQLAYMYELMYREKGSSKSFNYGQFDAYLKQRAVILTAVYKGDIPLVFHSYVMDEKQARLLHSVSDFRSGEINANLIGRANKRLHWEDIVMFKKQGKTIYDWGGLSSLENPNGIDEFKLKFGGTPVTYYNVYTGKSLIGKMAVGFLKVKNRKR